MGGCRCTYRTCSSRTDGKTHMFHYPVFDKVRCHQWITNARKLEFLNLKVSQLRNRVVCQHHFKDENFMNFKTNDNSQIDLNDNTKLVPVIPKDLILPKKPVKCVRPQIRKSTRGKELKTTGKSILNNASVKENIINHDLFQDNSTMQPSTIELSRQSKIQPSDLEGDAINFTINVSEVPVEFCTAVGSDVKPDETKFTINHLNQLQLSEEKLREPSCKENQPQKPKINHELNKNNNQPVTATVLNNPNEKTNTNNSLLKETKKIKIISEKKIVNPKPIIGKLEPVSPTRILTFPNKKRVINTNAGADSVEATVAEELPKRRERNPVLEANASKDNILEKSNNDSPTICLNEGIAATNQEKTILAKTKNASIITPKTSLLKNKIPPERVAAIAEKRKFNMKLRDIVEDCLDKLEEPQKTDYEKRPTLQETRLLQSKKRQVASHLSEEPQLPNVQEYTLAFLEARMKKMENNLLNKIEENSQKIMELKRAYAPSSSKKSVHTQTQVNEDVHKRHLYQELSKYLSQEANSLLYEELFINKYTKDMPKCSSPKRRKRR
ncbi:hypothetical protein HF086_015324 [Spodoptera exigua]|uniref:THAP-type domain-containing protein n=1 Tax=Spodoptera exigua TaxID=7107 RepID=A0A922M0J4_SPOEX|nr:hypothetical protein HF086_015324 [Spodoptera exigua]